MRALTPWFVRRVQLSPNRCSSSTKNQWTTSRALLLTQRASHLSIHHGCRPQGAFRIKPCPRQQMVRSIASATELPRVLINDLRSQEIVVEFNDGRAIRYPSIWLRDHCPCSGCTHPHTHQRQLETFHLNLDIKATSAEPTRSGLEVTWSDPDHASTYPWSWLEQHEPFSAKSRTTHQRSGWQHIAPTSPNLPTVNFDTVMTSDKGLSALLSQIRTFGLCFITNTPITREATHKLLQRISVIHATSPGAVWDLTSNPDSTDEATTNPTTQVHTDETYLTEPSGLKLTHVLQASDEGKSTFTDGFAAAQQLHKLAPPYYQILSQIPIVSQSPSPDPSSGTTLNTSLTPAGHPVFTHATPLQPALYRPTNLTQIRWNNAERHSSTVWPSHQSMQTWYAAAKAWSQLIASPDFQIETQLVPGTSVVVDNWRVLHGRPASRGVRRECGGYVRMDDFLARARAVDARVVAMEGDVGLDVEKDVVV